MFTGIIKQTGRFLRLAGPAHHTTLEIERPEGCGEPAIGESIAVNGICLTLTHATGPVWTFDVLAETLKCTTLTRISSREIVNLEQSLTLQDRLGGHFVTGHVDGIGKIVEIQSRGAERTFTIENPPESRPFTAPKGSIAVDGVSLTVGAVSGAQFKVHLIPSTLSLTNLGTKIAGDFVNVEADILARYAARISKAVGHSQITEAFLKEHGFL